MGFEIRLKETEFYVEGTTLSGIKKMADKVAADVCLVTKNRPVLTELTEGILSIGANSGVLIATIGHSSVLETLEQSQMLDLSGIRGRNECYGWYCLTLENKSVLVIAGSDKRGTIYGLFHLSESMGVSPLVNWSNCLPKVNEDAFVDESMACISKEPSVRFRGFFINDEWPAFGNWCNRHFGGFNSKAYEGVFELLLRMKGNYLWPAMWSGRFEDDGPGLANAELADEYGVVMGMSHHEPCLRQGEEYKYLRGKDSIYGDAWNFRTNREGITRFWEDGLKRSGKFENVITVGMRGEADTAILGRQSTLADNIELLRDVLQTQRELIRKNVNEDISKVPRMIALYKEVEQFFYGNEEAKGLMGSEELEDVILMLCDDNYGNLRTLPTEEMRKHKGGYGMYYHFDYHGWPVSYEWINSSYLPKIWEQMTQAYDFGIRDLWIVNVGDIATQEFPLSFFLDLAYDFERFGTNARNCTEAYTKLWVSRQFAAFSGKMQDETAELLKGYTKIIHNRRPEAMHAGVYHPVNYNETKNTLAAIKTLMEKAEEQFETVKKSYPELASAYGSQIYYEVMGTMNVTKMQLLAGWNAYLAKLGALYANTVGEEVDKCLAEDRGLVNWYHEMDGGRWSGMGMSQHIGFAHWNEDECANPVVHHVLPLDKEALVVTVEGTDQHAEGSPWLNNKLWMKDFLNPDCEHATIVIYNRSEKRTSYSVIEQSEGIKLSKQEGTLDAVTSRDEITVTIEREHWNTTEGSLKIKTPAGSVVVKIPVINGLDNPVSGVYPDTCGYVSMEAEHYYEKKAGVDETGRLTVSWECLDDYGKTLSAMKCFPNTCYCREDGTGPYLEYRYQKKEEEDSVLEVYLQPSNPVAVNGNINFAVQVNGGAILPCASVSADFKVGDQQREWSNGVLDQIRIVPVSILSQQGINKLRIYPLTPGVVVEKLVIYAKGKRPAESYLGPTETYRYK